MKKLLLLASGIFISTFANAGKNGVTELQKEKEVLVGKSIISNGFFLNIGIGFPTQTLTPTSYDNGNGLQPISSLPAQYTNVQSLGVQPNIEIGNQWYFWKNEKMGIGIRVSWFQFGYSAYTANYNPVIAGNSSQTNVDLRFIKVAPQFTLALAEKMALDFSFEISPTVFIGAGTNSYSSGNSSNTSAYANASVGFLFAPGIKFRYSKFAAGFDFGFGSLPSAAVYTNTYTNSSNGSVSSNQITVKGSNFTLFPRIYIGFKF